MNISDGGALIFASIWIIGFIGGLLLFGLNRAVNQWRESEKITRELLQENEKHFHCFSMMIGGIGSEWTAEQINQELKAGRIAPDTVFLADSEKIRRLKKAMRDFDGKVVYVENYRPTLQYSDGAGRTLTPIQIETPPSERNRSESGKAYERAQMQKLQSRPPNPPPDPSTDFGDYVSGLFDDAAEQAFYDARDAREKAIQDEIDRIEKQESEFAKGNRTPILELLSEIYDKENNE